MPVHPVRVATLTLACLAGVAASVEAQSLNGSTASMLKQNRVAQEHDYTFLQKSSDVRSFAEKGILVRLSGNSDYRLASVSFPYARQAVRTFVERLGSQYRNACGERLVVTSLTRPESRQPRNAHELSVHPAGMAVDIRTSSRRSCRRWIEETLLHLERQGVVEATRERRPSHYHVAVFPAAYQRYVAKSIGTQASSRLASAGSPSSTYRTKKGDTLWSIARRHGTTVAQLKATNGLRSGTIQPGQVLKLPGSSESASVDTESSTQPAGEER